MSPAKEQVWAERDNCFDICFDDNCFQYPLIAALNHKQIKSHPERISKIKPFIDQYNWKETDVLSKQKEWKKSELNNKSITCDILFVPQNTEEIRLAYTSKHNLSVKIK